MRRSQPAKFAVLGLMLAAMTMPALAAGGPPVAGGTLPPFKLAVPGNAQARSYLGLAASGATFSIPDIRARLVIIEIFSMY